MGPIVLGFAVIVSAGAGTLIHGSQLDWQDYVAGPQTRLLEPDSVEFVYPGNGSVSQPEEALLEDGESATIFRNGSASPQLAIDFGLPVSGKIEVVFGANVNAQLGIAFSQRLEFLQVGSDTSSFCLGDLTVAGRPGMTWRADARRGFRYVLLYLFSNGTVTIDAVRLYHTPFLATPDTYDGHFLCNDDLLNRIWYGCVYTQEICTTSGMECDGPWEIEEGMMSVSWDQEHEFGFSIPGAEWTDYNLDFDFLIMPLGKVCGWCFRGASDANTYMWQVVSAEGDTPNTLRKHVRENGIWTSTISVPLSQPVHEGEKHHVRTEVEGTIIRTYLDSDLIDTTGDATFGQGRIGFRSVAGEHFHLDNVHVTSATETLLFDDFGGEFLVLDRDKWERAEMLTINDGAKRDRVWVWGDFYPAQRAMFVAHWLPEIVANTLRDGAEHQYTDVEEAQYGGVLAGKIPAANAGDYMRNNGFNIIWLDDYTLWWVATLHHYWMHTGDDGFLAKIYPALRRVFELWAIRKHTGNNLLFLHLGDWYWSFLRQGEATAFNALYVNALRCGAEIAGQLGHTGDAATWSSRADSVESAINARLFDAANGLYVDGDRDFEHHPLDANTLTILYGIADKTRAAGMLDLIESRMWGPFGTKASWPPYDTWGHNQHVWVWYVQYETEARFRLNDDARAFETIRRPWGHMVDSDPGLTMWEFMMGDGSVESGLRNTDHSFSSGAAWLMSEYVAGIQPTSPGFATFDLIPHPGALEWVECTVPSPLGPFSVEYAIGPTRRTYQAAIGIPSGATGRVAVPKLGGSSQVELDGQTVWSGSEPTGNGYADDFYLYFPDVGPGEHTLAAFFDDEITPTPTPIRSLPAIQVY